MNEPLQKTIDIQSGRLMAGGEEYFIQNTLSTVRYVEYLKKLPTLSFGVTFSQMYEALSKIYTFASSGNDMIYAIGQARELSWNLLSTIKRFDEREILDIVDFCSLFINKAGEDISKFDQALHDQKAAILQKEGYDHASFFTLAFSLIENYGNAYHRIKSVSNPSDHNDIRLEPPTQQTSPIS